MLHSALHQSKILIHPSGTYVPFEVKTATTLLPFFNEEGRIRYGLLFHHPSSKVYFISKPTLIHRIGILKLLVLQKEHLVPVDRVHRSTWEQLYSLYHFDPWWLLRKPAFETVRGRSELKATNIASEHRICLVSYANSLSYVERMIDSSMNTIQWDSVIQKENRKSRKRKKEVSRSLSPRWVLDPQWV